MLRRLSRRAGRVDSNGGAASGHGDHWRCIFGEPRDGSLVAAIREAVMREPVARSSDGTSEYRLDELGINMVVLVRGQRVVTAYPAVAGSDTWSLTITGVRASPKGIEGRVSGLCMGAAVTFFATDFYRNRSKYAVGETCQIRMGALAYALGPAKGMEAEIDGGAKVSLAGASAYMPASGLEGASTDDYWFHSPIEGEVRHVHVAGTDMRIYPVTLGLPRDFPLSVNLCAAPHVEAPGTAGLQMGGDVQGYLWLQGSLAEDGK